MFYGWPGGWMLWWQAGPYTRESQRDAENTSTSSRDSCERMMGTRPRKRYTPYRNIATRVNIGTTTYHVLDTPYRNIATRVNIGTVTYYVWNTPYRNISKWWERVREMLRTRRRLLEIWETPYMNNVTYMVQYYMYERMKFQPFKI